MGGSAPDDNSDRAAEKSGKYSLQQSREEAMANRPNQYNPFGSVQWDREMLPGGKGQMKWTQRTNINPAYQGILDTQSEIARREQNTYGGMLNSLGGGPDIEQFGQTDMDKYDMGDLSQFGEARQMDFDPTEIRNQAQDAAFQYQTNRMDPRFEREAQNMEIQLRNKGLRPGDQAYDAQMSTFNNQKNDAYEQARLGSFQEGRAEADSMFNQQLGATELYNRTRQGEIGNYMQNLQEGFGRDQSARDAAITQYLKGRSGTLDEMEGVDPGGTMGGIMDTFGTGTGG